MIRLLVADDHAVVRRGVIQILEDAPEMAVVKEVSTGREVLQEIQENTYSIVLLDIAFPDMNGIDILKQIKGMKNRPKVLILSMYPEQQFAIRALQAGAAGYLTKESAPDELIAAIRKIAQGGKYISAVLAENLASRMADGAEKPHERLSDREFQVMRMLAKGKTVTEIAGELSLSVKSVSTYRTRILEKMEMRTTAEIIRYSIEQKLVD